MFYVLKNVLEKMYSALNGIFNKMTIFGENYVRCHQVGIYCFSQNSFFFFFN